MRNSQANERQTTAGYLELASRVYGILVENAACANHRALDYWKTVWEIASRPPGSLAPETLVRENFERANHVVALTAGEFQAAGHRAADIADKLLCTAADFQDSYLHSVRGLVNAGLSNATFVRDATEQQFHEFALRVGRMQSRSAQSVN